MSLAVPLILTALELMLPALPATAEAVLLMVLAVALIFPALPLIAPAVALIVLPVELIVPAVPLIEAASPSTPRARFTTSVSWPSSGLALARIQLAVSSARVRQA